MTSKLHKRLQTLLIFAGVGVLVAIIVLFWIFAGHHHQRNTITRSGEDFHRPPTLNYTRTSAENADVSSLRPEGVDQEDTTASASSTPSSHILGYVENANTELVRLEKISPPPLQGHDTIFDQHNKQQNNNNNNNNNSNNSNNPRSLIVQETNISSALPTVPDGPAGEAHHHSGHFRHLHTEIWDPHPQYVIKAFGSEFHLNLRHNAKFLRVHGTSGPIGSDGRIQVTHVFRNHTTQVKAQVRPAGCYYTGKIKGEPESDVAVSLCGGMTGYIRSKQGSFYIEPAEFYDNSSAQQSVLHRIHRINPARDDITKTGDVCETDTTTIPGERAKRDVTWTHHYAEGLRPSSIRSKYREYFIETLVVADKKMAEYHQTDEQLIHYILTLMSHVALLYKDATIGNPISISVVKIIVLHEHEFIAPKRSNVGHVDGVNSSDMLKEFCQFQQRHNGEERTAEHHDTALLLTRETICRNTQIGQCDSETLGLAELGSMCAPHSSCAIIKDKGLPTSYTIAHELGHVLSMPHDDDLVKCGRFNGDKSDVKYIMGRVIRNDTLPWLWSNCSRKYLSAFLESNRAKCLYDFPDNDLILNASKNLPGETFDADKQCELVFGDGLKVCTYNNTPKCRYLWCERNAKKDEGCITLHQPWADGTPCGRDSWCHRGACVARDPQILTPVAGGWSRWKHWGACSRTCGGGIQRAERECDSPSPLNGGPYCIGPSVRYGSCNTELCDEDAVDFREKQCAAFDGNNRRIPGLKEDVTWVPKYEDIEPEEMCQLYCRAQHTNQHYLLAERVVDGTKCGLNNFNVCVNGACRAAGCDNKLDSNLTLDACGVCGGDNSRCEQISGTYNAQPSYGYSKVVRIPRGSSNINIRQHGSNNRDNNYLALVDTENGRYVLNGDFHVSSFVKVIVYGGVTLEYTGYKSPVERINSSGSLRLKKDLLVELLSVDRLLPPNITYEYMIVKGHGPRYTWQLYEDEWSPCSKICTGYRRALPRCVETTSRAIVEEAYCEHLDRDIAGPSTRQECNTHCRLAWKVQERYGCSTPCGRGVRKIRHQCVKIDNIQQYEYLRGKDPPNRAEQLHLMMFDVDFDSGHLEDVGDVPWAVAVEQDHCSDIQKPPEVEVCEGSCESTRWHYEEWTQCSKSCGGGVQTRGSYCADSFNNRIEAGNCAGKQRHAKQSCNTEKCPTWSVGAEWTPCSVTCGRGYRTKPYHCHVDGRVLRAEACDAATEPLVKEPCEGERRFCSHWIAGDWHPVSCPCHVHVQRRSVTCRPLDYRSDSLKSLEPHLDESHCAGMLKPNETRPCPRHEDDYDECISDFEDNSIQPAEIFEWRSGPWSECSRSCDGGTMSRNVACQSKAGTQLEERCNPKLKPINRVQCGVQPCPTWNHGDWGSCNQDCHRYRLVSCQDTSGKILTDDRCPLTERPPNKTTCNDCFKSTTMSTTTTTAAATTEQTFNLQHFKWKISEWSPCSKSCGRGTKSRLVSCIDVGRNVTFVEHYCKHLKRPKTSRNCYRSECNFVWQEGPWTACTKSCGEGMKYRNVTCHRVLGHGRALHPDAVPAGRFTCNIETKPSNYEACLVRYCNEQYSWISGPWKECSHPCGRKGRQMRHLYCHHQGKKVPKKFCPRNIKPPRKQKCNQKRCTTLRSCADIKRHLPTASDQEYEIAVAVAHARNRNHRRLIIKVYCYNMKGGGAPQEYISLPNDGRDNYAEVYDKRLIDAETCPFNGARNDNACACILSDSGLAGLTVFRKVRLNVTTMQLVADDYTFSRQNSGQRVPYGTAGDCYSRAPNCPQGRFSINLNGTGLRLNGRVRWTDSGIVSSKTINKSSPTTVSGKCGGYCGSCAPDPNIGLLVEPDVT